MPNISKLAPTDQFPKSAIVESVQVQPDPSIVSSNMWFTIAVAAVGDNIVQWGKNVKKRDQQLRDFWPTESFLAGCVSSTSFRNAAFDWEIRHASPAVVKVTTDMIRTAICGDKIGWNDFAKRFSQDLYTQDNGAFIELIRDPGVDANSRFKGPMAPVIGIACLDSGQCTRTGNAEYPVLYEDRNTKIHKLAWYEVIPFSDYPSSIERMNGVGYSAITRALRLAQIMKSITVFKDEKIGGRHTKSIHLVSGVSRTELDDATRRGNEQADNKGLTRYMDPIVLASLDPEKPVSVASLDFASLPDNFDFDREMQWYIAGLALDFGVDYQDFAPLPGGNIGSGSQSNMLHRKSSGKGPRNWMIAITESFSNYGVLPRGAEMVFGDKNEQEELEKQEIRTKAMEEAAIAVNAGIMSPESAAKSLVERGIYKQADIEGLEDFWKKMAEVKTANPAKQPVGDRGGQTLAEDAKRQKTGKPNETGSDRLVKESVLEYVKRLLSKQQPVNVAVNVPERKETPAPIVVNVPKIKSHRQIVHRDANGDMSYVTTEYEYE